MFNFPAGNKKCDMFFLHPDVRAQNRESSELELLANDINKHCADLSENMCGSKSCTSCLTRALAREGYRKESKVVKELCDIIIFHLEPLEKQEERHETVARENSDMRAAMIHQYAAQILGSLTDYIEELKENRGLL
jgi:hypothetical protein